MTSPHEVSPELAALFRAERAVPPPADAVKHAMLGRVQQAAMVGGGASWLASVWVKGMAVLVVGVGVAGGVWYGPRARAHPRAEVLRAWAPATMALPWVPARTPAVATIVPTPVAPPVLPAAGTATVHSVSAAPSEPLTDEDLARENALMEHARDALRRRDATATHAAVHEHLAAFPHGRLTEEREAIWIEADVLAGDRAEAEARARRFRRRYPQSVELGVIDSALEGSVP